MQRPERLVDQAYRRIRDAIVSVEMKPGEPLDEKELSARLELGLTPVRDALKRLTLERLVVTYPRRGTFVTEINIEDESRLTEVRVELEGLAAGLAAERAYDDERVLFAAFAEDLDDPGEYVDMMDLDVQVHRTIYAAAHNSFLEDTLNQYANLAIRIWHFGLRGQRVKIERFCDPQPVIRAILASDPERARRAAEQHLRDFSAQIGSLLRSGH